MQIRYINISLSIEVRKRVLSSYFELILVYESESWTIIILVGNYLEVSEMRFYKRKMRIHGQINSAMKMPGERRTH